MAKFVRETNSQKWKHRSADEHVLNIADYDLPLPPTFKSAINTRFQLVNNFTYKTPSQQYYEAIIAWYRDRHIKQPNVEITASDITESPSLVNMTYILIRSQSNQGDGVLLLTPVWATFKKLTHQLGRRPIECRLYTERNKNISRYDINFTDLEEKAKLSKIMILSNPQNPTGRIWTKKQILKIVNICKQNQILLISDQILSDLVPDRFRDKFYSLVNCDYDRVVVGNSIGKAFNMQSLKGGYAIIKNRAIRQKYDHVLNNHLNLHTNEFASICTEVVYSQVGKQWLQNVVAATVSRNYEYFMSKVKNTLLIVSKFEGVHLIVVSFEGYVKFIERWFHSLKSKTQSPRHMVKQFLKHYKITGVQLPYHGLYENVYTDIRFAIGIEEIVFQSFTHTLVAALNEIEYLYRQIDPKL